MSESRWIDVMAAVDLPTNDVIGLEIEGYDIAIYTVGDQIYATDNICTHGQARLSDGFLEGCEIECPLHQGRFDVRDGRALCEPVAEAVRGYGVKVEGGRVLFRID